MPTAAGRILSSAPGAVQPRAAAVASPRRPPDAVSPAVGAGGGRIGGRFAQGPRIASGAFGEVFMGTDTRSGGPVAIKLELSGKPSKYLRREVEIYQQLAGLVRVPHMLWHGMSGAGGRAAVVTDLLGPSLADLFELCGRQFSLRTTLLLAEQLLLCADGLHARGVVHLDIKPENFLIGIGPSRDTVHIVDFGLAAFFRDAHTRQHIPWVEKKGRRGTRRYMSIQAGFGNELSRRDDLESIGYVLVYFLLGRLPWQKVKCRDKDATYYAVTMMKSQTAPEVLCQGAPPEFPEYVRYIRTLGFEERPDYARLRAQMRAAMVRSSADPFAAVAAVPPPDFDWSRLLLVAGAAQNVARSTAPRARKASEVSVANKGREPQCTSETHSPNWQPSPRLPSLDS